MTPQARTLAMLFLAVCAFPAAGAAPPFEATVVAVSDGDGFTARRDDGTLVKIRLAIVDSPEIAHNKKQVDQPYGPQALEFAEDQLQGERVTIYPKGESYHRTVARVAQAEGSDYGLDLLRAGYAWADRRFRPTKAHLQAEAEARKERRGLWAGTSPIEPRAWRAMTREQQRNHKP